MIYAHIHNLHAHIYRIFKYADDYLAVPASGIITTEMELEHIITWVHSCN